MRIINIETLYNKTSSGKLQQWTIEVVYDSYRTTEGFVNGKLTTTAWTKCKPTNIGKSNERDGPKQALFEADSKYKNKISAGWRENVEDIKGLTISPMLAHSYSDYKDYVDSQNKVASQPKLDGIRCIAVMGSGMCTRNRKEIVAAPHIWDELQLFMSCVQKMAISKTVMIDGELYNHELKSDFNLITSMVRKSNLTDKDITKSRELLQYHIYDLHMPEIKFRHRSNIIQYVMKMNNFKYLKFVKTDIVTKDKLDDLYAEYLADGYEGQMIRNVDSYYQNTRTKDLLKRKEFSDMEFKIVDIIEGDGNRSGMMGRIQFSIEGKSFYSNARGNNQYFRDLLKNKRNYIGKMATVRYQNLTPDGIPRFPVMIGVRFDI